MRTPSILAWMALAIAVVAALAFWDEERESRAALEDFAQEQSTLAALAGAGIADELSQGHAADDDARGLLKQAARIERPGVRVFLAEDGALVASDGSRAPLGPLAPALARGHRSARLSRAEASALGLPARTALAGLSAIGASPGRLAVVVVASAQEERDRQLRARWRLVLGLAVTTGLVVAFGGLAMRKQRKELELAHELELSALRTERDERLRRADKLATMGALASGIAHEVSTPLGVILGRAEQILPKQPDDRSRRAVETIAAQIERIHVVIRGFLALARGRQPALERCAPAALSEAAVGLVEHRFEAARVRLAIDDMPADLPMIACDPRLFEQVLVNLLLNACDACKEGGVVSLSVSSDAQDVTFVIVDDGVGIAPDVAQRVTEPFFTTKPEGKGTGLGLAIANEIVKHHMGALVLSPREGRRGTRASVQLPAAKG